MKLMILICLISMVTVASARFYENELVLQKLRLLKLINRRGNSPLDSVTMRGSVRLRKPLVSRQQVLPTGLPVVYSSSKDVWKDCAFGPSPCAWLKPGYWRQ